MKTKGGRRFKEWVGALKRHSSMSQSLSDKFHPRLSCTNKLLTSLHLRNFQVSFMRVRSLCAQLPCLAV